MQHLIYNVWANQLASNSQGLHSVFGKPSSLSRPGSAMGYVRSYIVGIFFKLLVSKILCNITANDGCRIPRFVLSIEPIGYVKPNSYRFLMVNPSCCISRRCLTCFFPVSSLGVEIFPFESTNPFFRENYEAHLFHFRIIKSYQLICWKRAPISEPFKRCSATGTYPQPWYILMFFNRAWRAKPPWRPVNRPAK